MRAFVIAMAFFGLTACASLPLAPEEVCLPPGVSPAVFRWPVVGAMPFRLQAESGDIEPGIMIRYQLGEQTVSVFWSRHGLTSVDTKPDDPQAPAWVDRGIVRDDGAIRQTPTERCRWGILGTQAQTNQPSRG